jgi:hypothetical protein
LAPRVCAEGASASDIARASSRPPILDFTTRGRTDADDQADQRDADDQSPVLLVTAV